MEFLKKWKYMSSKHKKLSEEWALATNLKDLSGSEDDYEEETEPEMFSVKFLGNTNIESARSEEATAEAVKAIISTAKATNKKLQRVNLCLSPKGIEILEPVTVEPIQQISIYRISYCSADAVHGNVFAFVCTEDLELDQPSETLVCYAFLCQKRKIAQKVTLTVARCFELAYQFWQETTERKEYLLERRRSRQNSRSSDKSSTDENTMRNLLIDFGSEISAEICSRDHRQLLQNTWVSFEDEAQHSCNITSARAHNTNMWEKNLIDCS